MRTTLGVFAGFLVWVLLWSGGELVLSALWPEFGAHQAAFQAAIENGGAFTVNTTMLLIHIVLASAVSMITGLLATMIAGGNTRAPLVLGLLLLAIGLIKAAMTWQLVPVWYHITFTAVLLPMAFIGGKLKAGGKV